jgi:hypothetical protein
MDLREAFETLGLSTTANQLEIRQAYRDLVKVWHPDRFVDNPRLQVKASQKLCEINEAFEVLRRSSDLPTSTGERQASTTVRPERCSSKDTHTDQASPRPPQESRGCLYVVDSWFYGRIMALSGEFQVFWRFASRSQSHERAVGGKLVATNLRLLFAPHKLDALYGGVAAEVSLNDIRHVGREPASGTLFDGGLRDRLSIDTTTRKELFVVNGLQDAIEQLNNWRRQYSRV